VYTAQDMTEITDTTKDTITDMIIITTEIITEIMMKISTEECDITDIPIVTDTEDVRTRFGGYSGLCFSNNHCLTAGK